MNRNRKGMLPGTAGVLFVLVSAVVLLGGWQRGQAEGGTHQFVWQNYVPSKHVAQEMTDIDAVADLNSNRLYVTHTYSTILRVNTETGVVEKTITSLERPEKLALSPNGERLYVSQGDDKGTISVVDTESFTVIDTLFLPSYVADMVVGPNERLYLNHSYDLEGTVSVLDTRSGEVVGDIELMPGNRYELALSPDGNVLYALRAYNSGGEMDFVRLDVSGDVPMILTAVSLPFSMAGVAIVPDGSYLWTSDLNGRLHQYHSNNLSLRRTLFLDALGSDAVVNSSGTLVSRLWYPNGPYQGAGGIQSFDTTTGEMVYQFMDTISLDESGYASYLIPLGQDRMALFYQKAIRIVKLVDYGVALPVVPGRYCGSSTLEDFSDPNSGWPSGQSGWTTYGYQDNQYRIHHQYANAWLGVTVGDVWDYTGKVQLEGQVLDERRGIWGFVFGLNSDWSNFYTFEIVPTHQLWWITHYSSGAGWQVIKQGEGSYIHTSGWNRMEIRGEGPFMKLVVNGVVVEPLNQVSGRIGISGGAIDGLLDIRYDNYSLIHENCPPPTQALNEVGPANSFMILERPPLELPAELP